MENLEVYLHNQLLKRQLHASQASNHKKSLNNKSLTKSLWITGLLTLMDKTLVFCYLCNSCKELHNGRECNCRTTFFTLAFKHSKRIQ